ncbi:MAG: alpha/beta fold hydrolase [Solirubrobacteraceae bacterium]
MSFLTTPEGFRLRVSDRGAGPDTVLLVHGWKGSHRLWDKVVVELAARHRVVSFDLRGMGESDKPRCDYDFDDTTRDVAFVIDELGLRDVTLVGWSMGCTVSLRYMASDGHGVERVVLMNGPLRLTQTEDFPHAMVPAEFEGYVRDMAERWPASEYEFQRDSLRDPQPAEAQLLYGIALQTPLDVALAYVRAQAKLDMRETLAQLPVPVLAVYSRYDPYYPTSLAEHIAGAAPDGQSVLMEQSAHGVPLEEPRAFAEALERFIASRSAGA